MKRKFNNEAEKVPSKTEGKTAGKLSKNIQSSIKPSKESDASHKNAKRSKFEKSTTTKKFDKSVKTNSADKTKKPLAKNERKDEKKIFAEASANGEKPNWLEMKKEKKELKEKRRAKKLAAVYEPSVKAKLIGEKLRRADCGVAEREKLTKELYELLKGNFSKAALTHDLSRVVQLLLKYGNSEMRANAIKEMQPSLIPMFQSKYAKNCIKKALKHGTEDIRKRIITSCYGHIVKLVSHSVSSPLFDYMYTNFATEAQKLLCKQEFYGDMYKQAKDDKIKTISDVYASAVDMKSATLSAVKINLVRILNKNLVASSILHDVLADYLNVCTPEDRAEIIVMLRNSIVELSRSENGAKVAAMCIWHGTNKDRKFSLKSLKQQVKNVCMSEHGHIVPMAIFDCVDDTVLVKKLILSEILADLVEIASNEYGRRVILYLVARRDSAYFHPALVDDLKRGDDNATSKKLPEIRENELVEAIIEPFLDSIDENVTSWLANGSIALVTLAILKRGHGEKLRKAFEAIAAFICNEESKVKEEGGEERAAVEHSGLHMMLKKLILTDKIFVEKKLVTFGQVLEEKLDEEIIGRWINFNRGCFLLILLIENGVESALTSLKKKLKAVSKTLKTIKSPGASILLKKIK